MQLTLIRHAIAEPGADDAARPLTKKGRRRFERAVETLDELGVRFDRVLHSPKRRAVETAELLAPILDGELVSTPLLARAPGVELWALLTSERLGVVGHEPHLSALLSWLITGEADGSAFELKKGGVAQLEGEPSPGGMKLKALFTPRVLRR
ncbi:MAG TPA: histidine phosphatase family protein [Archangium sp.]